MPATLEPSGDAADDLKNRNTVYVWNLDQRVKLPLLKETLTDLFTYFGPIVDIHAKANARLHGQAWVIFEDHKTAAQAIDEADGFHLFERPMRCEWARQASDAIAMRGKTEAQAERHKAARGAERDRRLATEASKKRKAPDGGDRIRKAPTLRAGVGGKGGAVPDEYLLPNRKLTVQNIPGDYKQEDLVALFQQFPGFKEVRTVPGRTEIAFVEYEEEDGAISAKERTNNLAVGANRQEIRVTYQRQVCHPLAKTTVTVTDPEADTSKDLMPHVKAASETVVEAEQDISPGIKGTI